MEYGDTFTVRFDVTGLDVLDKHQKPIELQDLYQLIYALQQKIPHYIYLGIRWYEKYGQEAAIYKIGVSDNPYRRAKELKVDLRHTIECTADERIQVERVLHGYLIERGKWAENEWFYLDIEDILFIQSLESADDILDKCDTYLDWYSSPPARWEIKEAYKQHRGKPLAFWQTE